MSGAVKGRDSSSDLNTSRESAKDGLFVHVFGRTDVGLVRDHNEDNFLVADLSEGNRSIKPEVRRHRIGPKGSLFVVCDGMGGAAAGEVASQIAVDTIYEMMQRSEPPEDDEELARRLETAIAEAGLRIFTAARVDRKRRGMGTTVTAAVMIGPRLLVGQVGDSRAYILRDDKLIQVTKDQSLVQQLLDAKQLTEEEAKNFDKSNIILQALGTAEEVHVDITSAVLRKDDVLVMCSDGLSGVVESEKIQEILTEYSDPVQSCKWLTDLACEGGGHDNITVIVCRFDGNELIDPLVDEKLAYRKFRFSSSADTTARRPMPPIPESPNKQPVYVVAEEEETERISSDRIAKMSKAFDEEPTIAIKKTGGSATQRWIFMAASIALAAGLLLIVRAYRTNGVVIDKSDIVPVQTAGETAIPHNTVSEKKSAAVAMPGEQVDGQEGPNLTMPEDGEGERKADTAPVEDVDISPPVEAEEKVATISPSKKRGQKGKIKVKPSRKARRPTETFDVNERSTAAEKATRKEPKRKEDKSASEKTEDAGKSQAKPIDDNPF